MKGKLVKLKQSSAEAGQYIYPITVADGVYVDPSTNLKETLIEMHNTMGKGSYVIDLVRWGISNQTSDFSNENFAQANSIGINAAIQWAKQQGYSEVVFPFGTYLLHEHHSVVPGSN